MSRFSIIDESGHLREDVLACPYSLYDRIRREEPVYYSEDLGGWILTRHADVTAAMRDGRLSANRTAAYLSELPPVDRERFQRFARARSDMLLFCDPPKHTRLRRCVCAAITQRDGHEVRVGVNSTVGSLLDDVAGRTRIDIVADLALPLPIITLLDFLGVPPDAAPQVRQWATAFNLAIGGVIQRDLVLEAENAVEAMYEYLAALLGSPKRPSGVMGDLHAQVLAGEMSDEEMLASCLMLLVAGHETTTNMIGNSVRALCEHPDELAWLRSDLRRVPNALDELVRYDAPVQLTAREATEPFDIGGKSVQPGDRVVPLWGAANHDPAVVDQPSRLDLRRVARPQLSFGYGRHRCLGASLARRQTSAVLTALLRQYRSMRVAEPPEWNENFSFRGLRRLVVDVVPA